MLVGHEHTAFLKNYHAELDGEQGYSMKKATMKLDSDEKSLLESVDRGDWKSSGGKRERARYSRYAKATFRKDRRLRQTWLPTK